MKKSITRIYNLQRIVESLKEEEDDLDLSDIPKFNKGKPRRLVDYLKNEDFVEYMFWHYIGYGPYTADKRKTTRRFIGRLFSDDKDDLDMWWSIYEQDLQDYDLNENVDDIDLNGTPTFKGRPTRLKDYLENENFIEFIFWLSSHGPYTPKSRTIAMELIKKLFSRDRFALESYWEDYEQT